MRSIVVKVERAGVRFSREIVLPWAATNLPADAFLVAGHEEFYWELEMQSFEANTLFVSVRSLSANPFAYDPDRKPRGVVTGLHFSPLPRADFLAQLSFYRLADLEAYLQAAGERSTELQMIVPDFSEFTEADASIPLSGFFEDRPVKFRVKFMDLTIKTGYAQGEAKFPESVDPIPFTIANDHLVAEFDTIKAFFVSRLQRQTIQVNAVLTNRPAGVWQLEGASSPQIDRIDGSMIEVFRTRTLRQIMGGGLPKIVDKQLFTPDDIFGSLEDEELGRATLPDDALDLLNAILASQAVRNAKQLHFLAGELGGVAEKLRYVLTPKFGFVFRVEGREANHFILELLNDHATYIWSIPNTWGTLAEEYAAIERELAKVGAMGRNQYRRLLSFEHLFWIVVHESSEGGVVDGFPRWRNRLLEGLG
ncbi:hypothetical protein [Lewinella sp. 4G2]|uniref:hypothetical protein n=1 Tax=Lewinella sp. 4G2 TaxID=1803372 RepID=UPI0007B4964D|nr:hypothetical protein [Lewinella sp. 4G2]OAV44540.1 hypothetical protein A3850_008565 [Lewinella sp. 4G2]